MILTSRHSAPRQWSLFYIVLSAQVGKEGKGVDDIQSVTLNVCHQDSSMILTRDMVNGDFGIRETSVGVNRDAGVKINMKDIIV